MNNSVTIATLTINELEQIETIERLTDQTPWTKNMLHDSLTNHSCWGLWLNNTLIGYLIFSQQINECSILKLAITLEEQHKGYATMLLKELKKQCQKQRIEKIFLEVRASNQKAQNLYRKIGFTEIGIRKNYYPTTTGYEDAIILSLKPAATSIY